MPIYHALMDPPRFAVRVVGWRQPLEWLACGLADLRRSPGPALAHGFACAGFGALIWWFAHDMFWVLTGAFSGFLLVAPIIATALYTVSRVHHEGRRPRPREIPRTWFGFDPRLVHFGVLLAFAGTGWVLTSASLVTAFAGAPIERPVDFLRVIVMAEEGWLFEIWLMLGALLAAPVFTSSVVAIPLLLDRDDATVYEAVFTSWRAVMASPGPLALWAALILWLTLVGMAVALVGLIFVVPWLAHASWHAYTDLVVRDGAPRMEGGE